MYPIIDELLKGGESRNVEFKAFWYWNNTTPNLELQKKYGEFLKDIIALFNTVAESGMKYLLIGVEEDKMKQGIPIKHPAFLDENNEHINDLLNLKEFETKFHKKLEIFTEPLQLENTDIKINISSYIKIELVGDLLLFAIQQAPCLLALKKDLQCQRGTFKTNAVIGRKLKGKNDPEIYQLPVNEVYSLQRELLQRKKAGYFDKDISIEKIAEAYLHTRLPQANKKPKITATSAINGICYEIHEIEDSCVQTRIKFLYFSKHTSQQKTWDTLKDNALVGNENKLFILLDRFNKNGGLINKEHIAKLVKKDIDSAEIYYLDDFIQEQLCGEKLEASIFHKHSFYIKNFIPPTLEGINDKGADLVFSEWLRETENPILVIKGTGGIGKTTVIKKFVDKILEDKTTDAKYKHVLFVSSHDIISDILARTENVKNVFDFYDILASKYNKEAISKDIFEILVGNGNLLVVLDGLDEVIANLGNRFNTELFLSSIIENCYNTFYKTKIIITCRDYFWDMQQLKEKTNIELVSLKAFDKEQVVKYFKQPSLKLDHKKQDKAIELAEKWAITTQKNSYIPYILDMITELLDTNMDTVSFQTKLLFPQEISTDFLLAKAFEREILKLESKDIDEQVKIFMFIATHFNGVLHQEHFNELCTQCGIQENFLENLKAHPLLRYDSQSQILTFRYDFFNDFFKNISIANYLKQWCSFYDNNSKNKPFETNKEMERCIVQNVVYHNKDILGVIVRRLELFEVKPEGLQLILLDKLQTDTNLEEYQKILYSNMLILLLEIISPKDAIERTSIIKELFEENGVIKNINLINIHSVGQNKLVFDFKGCRFENCHFENYEHFASNQFDPDTFFKDTTFIAPLWKEGIQTKLSWKNIDKKSCNTQGLVNMLNHRAANELENNQELRKKLKTIIKFFWSRGCFQPKSEDEVRRHLGGFDRLFKVLLDKKILKTEKKSDKHKRENTYWFLNSEYSDLRKIMEENDTCRDFEHIVSLCDKESFSL